MFCRQSPIASRRMLVEGARAGWVGKREPKLVERIAHHGDCRGGYSRASDELGGQQRGMGEGLQDPEVCRDGLCRGKKRRCQRAVIKVI